MVLPRVWEANLSSLPIQPRERQVRFAVGWLASRGANLHAKRTFQSLPMSRDNFWKSLGIQSPWGVYDETIFENPLGILAHLTSNDEWLGWKKSPPQRNGIFRFHETILSFGEPGSLGFGHGSFSQTNFLKKKSCPIFQGWSHRRQILDQEILESMPYTKYHQIPFICSTNSSQSAGRMCCRKCLKVKRVNTWPFSNK